MAKRKLLHVRETLERIIYLREHLDIFGDLLPALREEIISISLIAKGILRKHEHSRKDCYVESPQS